MRKSKIDNREKIKIALAGNPNCGKTTLFNALTGATAHVGNWTGVTVEKLEGTYRDKKADLRIDIVDLPGIYSLSPYSPEEIISRDYLLSGDADLILNIIDATNLERNLYLTTQLLEIGMPIVVALNMEDCLKANGESIDVYKLSDRLGVPVVSISALKQKGLKELMQTVKDNYSQKRNAISLISNTILKDSVDKVMLLLDDSKQKLFESVKLVEGDKIIAQKYSSLEKEIQAIKDENQEVKKKYNGNFESCVADCRYNVINEKFADLITRDREKPDVSKSDKADKVLTHRIWGIPIFLVIMLVIFHITFSSNFLYLSVVIPDGAFADVDPISALFVDTEYEVDEEGNISGANALKSPGVFLQGLVEALGEVVNGERVVEDVVDENGEAVLDEEGNALSEVVEEGGWIPRLLANAPDWAYGVICDGILAGVFGVLSFIPQIMVLFLFLTILEDTGYMARVAFIMDKAFRRIGLSGKSFMPLLMCFGCAVPGIMATRTIENNRERKSTILLAPFFSCGAKSPIWYAFAAVLASTVGWNEELTVFSVYLVGILVAMIAALILKKISGQKGVTPFIMELPTYHTPQFKSVSIHIWQKLKHFVFRAGTVIAASTVIIWYLLNFNFTFHMVEESQSILATVGGWFEWLFKPLGFGNWKFIVASVTGLIAKEEVISSIEVLAGSVEAFVAESGVSTAGIFAFMSFNLLTIPCMAAVGAAASELGSTKRTMLAILFWILTSYIVAMTIYLVGTYWWTVFIFAALVAIIITVAHFVQKNRANKMPLEVK
ncbi:MAG: ferrous iron transporter B [Clostridiales bacterium]|nr:ferrous iron transporter B [Clostridiales bacterium]